MVKLDQEDDDIPQLSAGALDALKEFYGERDARQKQFEELKGQAEDEFEGNLSMEAFTEDWNASQFWYSDETATVLARQLLDGATDDTRIAVVSAPSAFIQLKNLLASGEYQCRPHIKLLEYDERFAVFKEFVRYDFEKAIQLPAELKGSFDVIICDPPFLSQDCQTKAALTVRWLAKVWNQKALRLIVCTGERMETLVTDKLYGKVALSTTMAAACIFCKIIRGEIPSMKIFESEKTLAFLDIGPLSKGHSLIIPKHHGAKLHDIPDDQLAEVLSVTKRIAIAQGVQDYNILQNNGKIAHQVVDHVHFHLIPKPNEEEGLGIGWPTKPADKDQLTKLLEEIKAKM
ncbi:Protein-lysine N-methyltransferase efm5 [Neocucurbitaria cava]|uniref:Protein-lysine N-methyltransferase EFM5 n=1 Tax=Neocucurbitaria cava TaxID=798079 RepID=A0A9W9CJP0_9PLEO|nr:Protein-lysine N-methyltransferase efm5 [Neocucurbitaria cava]